MAYFKYSLEELDDLKSKDKKLKKYIEEVGLIQREVIPNLYEALVSSIVGQQISTKAAETIRQRLKAKAKKLRPEEISKLSMEELRSVGLNQRKAEYIQEFTDKVLSKEFDLKAIKKMNDEEAIVTLASLRGVGVWTAQMMLLFSLQRKDILSYDDLGIRRGLCLLYGHTELDKKQFLKYKEKFSPYGSLASLYLWEKGNKK